MNQKKRLNLFVASHSSSRTSTSGVYLRRRSGRLTRHRTQHHCCSRILLSEHHLCKRIQHSRRQWNQIQIIRKRPEQIQPDPRKHLPRKLHRSHRSSQIRPQQHNTPRRNRRIRPAAHCNTHICLHHRRRIINTILHKQSQPALPPASAE